MFSNNNKKIIKKISYNKMKTNRSRYLLIIVAIALTSVLLTATLTVSSAIMQSFEYTMMRQVGTKAHAGFKYLTDEQYEVLKNHDNIKSYGKSIIVGVVEDERLIKRKNEIHYQDANSMAFAFITPLIDGNAPVNKDDILLDTITLDLLGLSYDVGQEVELLISIDGESMMQTFNLCGIYEGDHLARVSRALVSESYVEEYLRDIDLEESYSKGTYTGLIQMDMFLDSPMFIEEEVEEIIVESGYELDDIAIGINWAYMGSGKTMNPEDMIAYGLLLFMLMFSGYLIIYNTFYIGIVNDVKFYGLLKTIGATKKQIKSLVVKQGLKLSIIGIPIGLFFGYILGLIIYPYVVNSLNVRGVSFSMNPMIFIFATLLTLITVYISCLKPARIAGKVSPVEAIKDVRTSIGNKKVFGKKNKLGTSGGKIYRIALRNFFRNKKKAIILILSMTLSLVLLNSVYTIINSNNENKYVSYMIPSDFVVAGAEKFNYHHFDDEKPVSKETLQAIANEQGVEINNVYCKYSTTSINERIRTFAEKNMEPYVYENTILGNQEFYVDIYGLDDGMIPYIEESIVEGDFDKEKFVSGKYVLLNKYIFLDIGYDGEANFYNIGDKISLVNNEGVSEDYEVLAFVENVPSYLYDGNFTGYGISVYVSANNFSEIDPKMPVMLSTINVDEGQYQAFSKRLDEIIKEEPMLIYKSREEYIAEIKSLNKMLGLVGYSLSSIIGIIAILNFINVFVTSIIVRRQELAMLQSVGMTSKQLVKMLILESIYAVGIAIGLSVLICHFTGGFITQGMMFTVYEESYLPVIIVTPIITLFALLTSYLSFRKLSKDSLVERLKVIE